ncbi:hypothetical protein SNEBB_007093 [Seison nebaliae]|nr:hypothetical protein SNEBB_007093 [Seison nebaliae]
MKCELALWNYSDENKMEVIRTFQEVAPELRVLEEGNTVLLGSPLTEEAVASCLAEKRDDLARMCGNLKDLHSHDAFFLLRTSLAIPKMVYVLRTSLAWKHPEHLQEFDDLLFSSLEQLLNVSLSDMARLQASLPVRDGGLGIRRSAQLALPCFLASVASSEAVMSDILQPHVATNDALWTEACDNWKTSSGKNLPPESDQKKQKAWDSPLIANDLPVLSAAATLTHEKARLLAAQEKQSGAWLNAIPIPSLGTRLEDNHMRIAVALRLGTPIFLPHNCAACPERVQEDGLHGLSCMQSKAGTNSRHEAANNTIQRALSAAGYPATREPRGLMRGDQRRPDGSTLVAWKSGKFLVWDFTCGDTFAATYVEQTSRQAGAAAERGEASKLRTYEDFDARYDFQPICVETSGVWTKGSLAFIKEVGRRIGMRTRDPRSTAFLLQRLSLDIQRGNAVAIQTCAPASSPWDFEF